MFLAWARYDDRQGASVARRTVSTTLNHALEVGRVAGHSGLVRKQGESRMKQIVLAAILSLAALANAQASCKSDAADKKLAGAALSSFMKKCESDAKAACAKSSADQKLAGAAKTSHEKKCVSDAVGK